MAYFKKSGIEEEDPNAPRKSWALPTAPPTAGAPGVNPNLGAVGDPAKAGGGGWVNLERYLGVAGGNGRAMAGQLAGGVRQQATEAVAGTDAMTSGLRANNADAIKNADPSKVTFGSIAEHPKFGEVALQTERAGQNARGLGDFSQRRDLIQQQYGVDGNYSLGEGQHDSFLAGAAGGDLLKTAGDRYGGLSDSLGLAVDASAQEAATARGTAQSAKTARDAANAPSVVDPAYAQRRAAHDKNFGKFMGHGINEGPGRIMGIHAGVYSKMTPDEIDRAQALFDAYGWGGLGDMFNGTSKRKELESFGKEMVSKYAGT